MLFLHAGESVTLQYKGQAAPQIYRIVFDCYQLAERQDDSLLYRLYRDHLPDNGWITDKLPYQALLLSQEMVKQHHPEQARQSGRCHFLLDELLHIVFSNDGSKQELDREPSIENAFFYIQEHYHMQITRSFIAQMTGFNRSYFSTLFRKQTGWGFSDYLNRMRVDKAKELLSEANRGKRGY